VSELPDDLKEDAFEGIINDPELLTGLDPADIALALPGSWVSEPGRDAGTIRYRPKGQPGVQILVEPGFPEADPINVHSGPYARVSDGRGAPVRIPLKGNPTL